jgi:putative ATP-dependent endonuclease of the OLD family
VIIRRLTIERYRGIQKLVWHPAPGVNALVGPADSGKSTVLGALARLLTPRAFGPAPEYDYYQRELDAGFQISAVIGDLDDEVLKVAGGNLIGWLNGKTTPLPDEGGAEAALHCRVRATGDFEVIHELLDGNEEASSFGSAIRRAIRFARIPTEDIAHNELRLGRGSLLERAVGDEGLRSPLTDALAQASADPSLLQMP